MALSDIQNEGYKRNVGRRNIGSQPSGVIKKNAQSTAIGRNIRRPSTNTVSSNAPKARGSMEGYMHGASTYIQMNGSGYDNKIQQKARGPRIPKELSGMNRDNPISRLNHVSKNVFDYSNRGLPNSSKSRLAKVMKLNKLF